MIAAYNYISVQLCHSKMVVQIKLRLYFSLTLQMHLFSLIRAQNFQQVKQGVSFAHFVRDRSVILNVNNRVCLSVSKLGECTFECINHEECYSLNFGHTQSANGTYACELLRTNKFLKAGKLAASDKFDHYFIKVSKTWRIQPVLSCLPTNQLNWPPSTFVVFSLRSWASQW